MNSNFQKEMASKKYLNYIYNMNSNFQKVMARAKTRKEKIQKTMNSMCKIMNSYCLKDKKLTKCAGPFDYKQAKNGRLMFFCKCDECGMTKAKPFKKRGSLEAIYLQMCQF